MIVAERKKVDIAAIQRQQGIRCPDCHCRHFWDVTKTYPKGNAIKRTRECRHCGYALTTWERPEEIQL